MNDLEAISNAMFKNCLCFGLFEVSNVLGRWVEKNVDLELLSECVEDFFKRKGFKTMTDESMGEYKILLISQGDRGIPRGMYVRISGDPNEFVLELCISERARSSVMLGLMTTMFGGGSRVLRSLKSQEFLERLEREFWICVEEAIEGLVGSAGRCR